MMRPLVALTQVAFLTLVSSITPISQINALHSLYNQTDGENWRWRNESDAGLVWSFNSTSQKDPCNSDGVAWQGITCSSIPTRCRTTTCNIVAIKLVSYGLAGPIPSDLFTIASLTSLKLDINQLSGPIPSSIGSLSQLQYFWLSYNEISGPFPSSIGSLLQLHEFDISYNYKVTGTIPASIGSLAFLELLWIHDNRISGTIPSSVGSLSRLLYMVFQNNRFSGTIPSSVGSLSQLEDFLISINRISGTIPSSVGLMSNLVYFKIFDNQISGTIPSSVGSLSRLHDFWIFNNQISGTIPSSIESCLQLQYFATYNNQISGTIPSSVGSLSRLQYFAIFSNHISGTIPSTVGSLSRLLQYFDLADNGISGTLPSFFGSFSRLVDLDLSKNRVSGTIPSAFNALFALQSFHVHSNRLTGSIPLQLSSLSALAQLFLHENRLKGSLDHFLLDYNPFLNQSVLINLDVSGNELTGTIPGHLFLISSLDSIALSVNCFHGELPTSICDAVNVSVMSLDGLQASTSCGKQSTVPFTSVSLDRMIGGRIPDCVWQLSNLNTLHLAGNGFRGRIGNGGETTASNRNNMPRLVDLTLSHNYLSGEIPTWLLKKRNMKSLDLSHNKLTGDLDDLILKVNSSVPGGVDRSGSGKKILKLGVNRLSGRLPPSMDAYSPLDILSGNLFSCDTIPPADENSDYYVCGSSEYNQSMEVFGGVLCILILFIVLYFFMAMMSHARCGSSTDNHHFTSAYSLSSLISRLRQWSDNKKLLYHQLVQYLRFYHHFVSTRQVKENDTVLLLINRFGKTLVGVEKLFLIAAATIIVFSVPLYVLKDVENRSYVTRYHQYQWYFTMSYLSGIVPGLLLMILCFISLLVFRFTLWYLSGVVNHGDIASSMRLGNHVESLSLNSSSYHLESNEREVQLTPMPNVDQSETLNHHGTVSINQSLDTQGRVYLCAIFLVNMVMVGTVNGFYIWSTVQKLSRMSRLLIQLSVSLFGMIWELLLRRIFPNQLKHSFSVVWVLCLIGVINGLLIPCVVTSLTSPSCYQRLIIEPEDISSSYTYTYCSAWFAGSVLRCISYATGTMQVPPMTPPFIYSYQCGSTILTSYIPVNLYSSVFSIIVDIMRVVIVFQTKYEDYPKVIRESQFLPHVDLNATWVISTVVNNMILLLSFGLSSPVLCFGICVSAIINVLSYLIRLGRLMFRWHGIAEDTNDTPNTITIASTRNSMQNSEKILGKEVEIRETRTSLKVDDVPGDLVPISLDTNPNVDQEVNLMKKSFGEMKGSLKDGLHCVKRCKWLIMAPSCLFITVLSWDIAGDEEGWDGSFWIPLMGVGTMATVYLCDYSLMMTTLGNQRPTFASKSI